jgi:hypothetical protein
MPVAKTEYYANNSIDSIKQYLMMQCGEWDTDAIRAHGQEMIKVLVHGLEPQGMSYAVVPGAVWPALPTILRT